MAGMPDVEPRKREPIGMSTSSLHGRSTMATASSTLCWPSASKQTKYWALRSSRAHRTPLLQRRPRAQVHRMAYDPPGQLSESGVVVSDAYVARGSAPPPVEAVLVLGAGAAGPGVAEAADPSG